MWTSWRSNFSRSFGFPQILWQNNDTYLSFESHRAIVKWCQDLESLCPYSVDFRSSLASPCFHFLIISQLLTHLWLFVTPWTPAPQNSLFIMNSQSLLKLKSILSVMSPPSPPAFSLSQNQSLFQWAGSSHQVAKILEFQLQHQFFQWTLRTDLLQDGLVGSPCSPRDSQESSPTPRFKSINSSVLSFLYGSTLTSIHDYWKNHSLD